MVMDGDLPNSRQDVTRLTAWLTGRLRVPARNVIVVGERRDVPTEFDRFGCLYPDGLAYRAYLHVADTTGRPGDRERLLGVRAEIAEIRVPEDAERTYREFVRATLPGVMPVDLWEAAAVSARQEGIPIGCYAAGRTVTDGKPVAALWMHALVPPAGFAWRLQAAARHQPDLREN